MFIAISGNIGSGKTSLTEMLASRFGWNAYYENVDNPYLDDFYQDMKRWSFNLQMCFLSKKIHQLEDILKSKSKDIIIQDRTVFEEGYVFVKNLHNMGLMSTRDYDTYMDFFNIGVNSHFYPDLVVYLKSSVPNLVSQIQKRGRVFEMSIQEEYLERLNILYDDWVLNNYKGKVLIIDVDKYDFVLHSEDLEHIIAQITQEINKIDR